ncbi:MAG: arylsulfatase [Planctomycetota bacterium]
MRRLTLALTALAACLMATPHAQAAPPNIVIFLADDMGWADVGFHGGDIPTPHIDRIAESGVIFDQFHVQPTCSPSRHALITGRHPFRYGAHICNGYAHTAEKGAIEDRFISEAMNDAGYYTAIIGKWHLGSYRRAYWPTSRGFDMFYGLLHGSMDYYTHRNNGDVTHDWQELHADGSVWQQPLSEEGYVTDLLGSRAVRLVESHDFNEQPLFLYLSFTAPHTPMQAKPEDRARFDYIADGRRRTYAAMMHSMDQQIGNVMQALEARGVADNTLVIFTNDNGGAEGSNASDNGPLRGTKGTPFEGGTRVPFAMAWPSEITPGTRFNEVLHVIDLFPTLVTLAGGTTDQPNPLDGVDFWPALTGQATFPTRDLYHNVMDPSGRGFIRSGDWKFIAIRKDRAPDDAIPLSNPRLHGLLFNIADDPGEQNNLAAQLPDLVEQLWNKLKARGPEVVSAAHYCAKPPQGWRPRPDHALAAD